MAPKQNKCKVVNKVSEETDNSCAQPGNENNSHASSVSMKRQKTDEEIESYSTVSKKDTAHKERSRSKNSHRTD